MRAGLRRGWKALALVAAVLVAAPVVLVWLTTSLVVVDDSLSAADLIFVLNGRIAARATQAAAVYERGLAPRVVIAHTRERMPARRGRPSQTLSDFTASWIVRLGVPDSAVTVIPFDGGVVDTRDEARALSRHLEVGSAERVIVVTSEDHTGRARRTLRQELRGQGVEVLMAAAIESDGITRHNWWRHREGIRRYLTELAKQAGVMLGM